MSEPSYLPALRFRALTGLYDPLIRLAVREATFKSRLVEQAGIRPGHRVLDLGCGTGTLALTVKETQPDADVTGIDADAAILSRAEAKTRAAGVTIDFDEGRSDALPYERASFDRVLATLFFHHLDDEVKRVTVAEITRVLRPGGELHVADWGRPSDPLMRALSWQIRLFDGRKPTRANLAGMLPAFFEANGLSEARETGQLRTVFGTLTYYRARQPTAPTRWRRGREDVPDEPEDVP